jgi:hypothetical protein
MVFERGENFMKKMLPRIIIFIVFTIVLTGGFRNFNVHNIYKANNIGLKVEKWDNIYEQSNIEFYYIKPKNENIRKFGEKYALYDKVNAKEGNLNKSFQLLKWLNSKVEYREGSGGSSNNAIDIILKEHEEIKVSDEDFITLFNESAAFLEITNRIGIFRGEKGVNAKGKTYYKICEIWSDEFNKWVMIDVCNGYYMMKDNIPLGAIEVISEGFDNVKVVRIKGTDKSSFDKQRDEYIKRIEKYLYTYSIEIDNNKYGEKIINSYITFIKPGMIPQIETEEGFLQPTIFVNRTDAFNISPSQDYVNNESDEKITMIFAKKSFDSNKEGVKSFYLGAFKNSVQIKDYFVSINGHDWYKMQDRYFFDLEIKEGKNTIKISEDGKTAVREVVIVNE